MQEITVNIRDILIRFLRGWKKLLIMMLLGALVLNLLAYSAEKKRIKAQRESQEMQQESRETVEKSLSSDEKKEVEAQAVAYYAWQKNYENLLEYCSNSVAMQLDANAVPIIEKVYRVSTQHTVTYPEIEVKKPEREIAEALAVLVPDEALFRSITDAMGEPDNTYVRELIDVKALGDSLLRVTVLGRSFEECRKIMEVVSNRIPVLAGEMANRYGAFDCWALGETAYSAYSPQILSLQRDTISQMNTVRNNFMGVKKNLSANQVKYLFFLNSEYEEEKEKEENIQNVQSDKAKWLFPKYVLAGALLGAVLYLAVLVLAILMRGKIQTEYDLERGLGLTSLGSWREKGKSRSGWSRWLDKLSDGPRSAFTPEENRKMTAAAIRIGMQKKQFSSVFLAASSMDPASELALKQLLDELTVSDINAAGGAAVLYNPEEMEKMSRSEAVVLLEKVDASSKSEILKEMAAIREYGLPVIGYVTIK